jgi:pyruvate formate lyase activating enzyme
MQAQEPDGSPRGINELVADVARDTRYWRASGGGVTLSGGEPLLQPEACVAFLSALAGKGCHTCVETSGYASADTLLSISEVTTLFLFDLKTVDAGAFREATAGDLDVILGNVQRLLYRRADSVWLRIPLIEGFNADEDSLHEIARFISGLPNPARLQLLPGHRMGVSAQRDPTVDAATCRRAQAIVRQFEPRVEICW